VLLSAVLPGGNAARAGLQAGDVLLRYGQKRLSSSSDLGQAVGKEAVVAAYWREGKQGKARLAGGPLGVVVDKRPAAQAVRAWREERTLLAQRGTGHKPLPGTALEVKALARLMPGATTLLGSDASEQELDRLRANGELKKYRFLHLATHGEVNYGRPELSSLILAQDRLPDPLEAARAGRKAYDGRLTVATVLRDWELTAEMVVLSACESGQGKFSGGEGLLGFAQALLQKGARSVVLSLWKVDDAATALLMARFYENLLGKRPGLKAPLPKAEALHEAKRWLRQLSRGEAEKLVAAWAGGELRGSVGPGKPLAKGGKAQLPAGERPFARPYYWAAFVLIGDPQ
jgi:CHAT domain-containing protein